MHVLPGARVKEPVEHGGPTNPERILRVLAREVDPEY